MFGEIITIGNELISGRTLDLNSRYAAEKLTAAGLGVTRITTVGDDPEMVSKALKKALKESRFVITTGGLGSTEDDITNDIVAGALNRPLRRHHEMFELIKDYVEARGMALTPSIEKMAWMPEGSKILNLNGDACGFVIIEDEIPLYFLPGVPEQMRYLMDKVVLAELLNKCRTLFVQKQRILKLYGISEPEIAEILKGLPGKTDDIILGFYPYFSENHIIISLKGKDESDVVTRLDRIEKEIRDLVGSYIFATGDETMESVVGSLLKEREFSMSVAESCTGGLIGNLLTNVAGSSSYFQGGLVLYGNQSRMGLLEVSSDIINKYGAVSSRTVQEMADLIKKKITADIGLAVTGIAGPSGDNEGNSPGTVYIGLATNSRTFSGKYHFRGTRKQVRLNTSMMALDWVRRYLNEDSFLPGI